MSVNTKHTVSYKMQFEVGGANLRMCAGTVKWLDLKYLSQQIPPH